jgi:ferredoxin-NADP reductase
LVIVHAEVNLQLTSALPTDTLLLDVSSVAPATPSTRIVRLDLGGRAFPFEAGQSALIGLAEREERVPYSIASAPAESAVHGGLDFLIKVEPSGRWGHQFDSIEVGQKIGIQGPFGSFLFPRQAAEERFVFVAGGTGVAPIRAMIREALLTGRRARMSLLYSAKTADDFAYLPELSELALENRLGLSLHVTRETPDSGSRAGAPATPRNGSALPKTERGRIGLAQLTPLIDDPATLCFVCGPESMVADVPRMLLDLGIDRSRIKIEEW